MKTKLAIIMVLMVFLVGCATTQRAKESAHETFVYTYEEIGFHMQMAKEMIIMLAQSGDLSESQYEMAKNTYNEAVDVYQNAGEAYKAYLTATDAKTAIALKGKYNTIMLDLTKLILKVNTMIKGGNQV